MQDLLDAATLGTSPYWHHEYEGNRVKAVLLTLYVYVRPSKSYH